MSKVKNYIAWDLEWSPQTQEILCAAFVDDSGKEYVFHVSDFDNSERKLLLMIKQILLKYPLNVGYYSTGSNSDIPTLNRRFIANNIPSIINEKRLVAEPFPGKQHIDLFRVFDKQMVKGYIYNGAYKSMKLNEVAQALLGRGKKGKGADVLDMDVQTMKEYNLEDARITMDLSKAGDINQETGTVNLDGGLFDLMLAIAEKTQMSFVGACHYGITTLWANVFDKTEDAPAPRGNFVHEEYEGGIVLEPKVGLYENIKVVDVTSLYPSMAIKYNISYDTVNCECCKNNRNAQVPKEVLDETRDYWICQRKEGIFTKKLKQFKADRVKEKRAGNKVAEKGLKILINGGYGAFGNEYFKYASMPVAKLIPAYGRYTHRQMQEIAPKYNLEVIAGDTDSLFLKGDGDLEAYIADCQKTLDIELEHEKTFRKLIITGKKHYFGHAIYYNTKDKSIKKMEPLVKGMEGKKDDRPEWIRETFDQFVNDFCNDMDPTVLLEASWDEFKNAGVPMDKLTYSVKLQKNPESYDPTNLNRKLGQIANARAGDVIKYWKIRDGVTVETPKFEDLDKKAYEETFITTFEDSLKILGKDVKLMVKGQEALTFWFG